MDKFFDDYMQEHIKLTAEFQKLHLQLKDTIRRFNEENRQAQVTLEKMKIDFSSSSLFLIRQNPVDIDTKADDLLDEV